MVSNGWFSVHITPTSFIEQNYPGSLSAKMINIAYDNGGYVAGGFAAKLRAHEMCYDFGDVHKYIGVFAGGYAIGETLAARVNLWRYVVEDADDLKDDLINNDVKGKDARGDIDIFFEDESSFERTVSAIANHIAEQGIPPRLRVYETQKSLTFKVGLMYISLIKHHFGKPEDILNTFDINNCRVAYRRDKCYTTPDWDALMKSKLIDINEENIKSSTIYRIRKYVKNAPAFGVSTEVSKYLAKIGKMIMLAKLGDEETKLLQPPTTMSAPELHHLLVQVSKTLTMETLLELSIFEHGLCNPDGAPYFGGDTLEKVLYRRIANNV